MHSRRIPSVGAAIVLCAWCGWVSGAHRNSVPAEITWVVSLAAVVVTAVLFRRGRWGAAFGWDIGAATEPWPRADRGGRSALRGVAPWLVVILAAAAWDGLGIDTGPHEYHLTISALSQTYRPLNALLLLVWMVVGIGYAAARARAPSGWPDRDGSSGRGLGVEGQGGAVVCAAGLAPGGGRHTLTPALLLPSNRPVGVVFWVGLLVVAVVVDVWARRTDGRIATAEEFARFISSSAVVNVALIAAWAFAGYHLFAR